LSGLTDSPCSPHHPSTECRAHCVRPDTVFGDLPTARRQMEIFPSLSLVSNSSATSHHSRGDSTPPCGQPLATAILLETPRVAVACRLSRVALIHHLMVGLTPCLTNAAQMES
jgi:hypothetical protein